MRRISLLLASVALVVLLASGVALAANIACDGGESCVGTNRSDVLRGDSKANFMYGRGGGDTLKGFGRSDNLFGNDGDDRLLGGPARDYFVPDSGDDTLSGGDGADLYYIRGQWDKDTITDPTTNNDLSLLPLSTGTVTTRLTSEPLLPEVADATGTNTIDWDGNVVRDVTGSRGDDNISGNDDSNTIFDGTLDPDAPPDPSASPDTDNITGEGGDDTINVMDGDGNDTVDCGEGTNDKVFFDTGDTVNDLNCEGQSSLPQQ